MAVPDRRHEPVQQLALLLPPPESGADVTIRHDHPLCWTRRPANTVAGLLRVLTGRLGTDGEVSNRHSSWPRPGSGGATRWGLRLLSAPGLAEPVVEAGLGQVGTVIGDDAALGCDQGDWTQPALGWRAGQTEATASRIVAATEAGGHTGQIATMVLVPEVVDAVEPVPVLAAGGIARGRQLLAGMALGAAGVWCGSVWLTTEEAETPPPVKEKYLGAGLGDTVRSRSITGKPARMLRSPWTDAWDGPDSPGPLPMPLQTVLVGEALSRVMRGAAKEGSGAQDLATYFVGQVVGSLSVVKPTRQVVLEMVEEFIDALERVNRFAAS